MKRISPGASHSVINEAPCLTWALRKGSYVHALPLFTQHDFLLAVISSIY